MKSCESAWLVSASFDGTTDALAYCGSGPSLGCNILLCGGCGARVGSVNDRASKTNLPLAAHAGVRQG